jgi:hypothetical protein
MFTMKETDAREQFVHDFLMVSENDQDTYFEYSRLVRFEGVLGASEAIKEQFEQWVNGLAEQENERGNEYGAMLLRELLVGWGSDCFSHIAKRFEVEDASN